MKKYNVENLVLLIDKKGNKDKFVIAEINRKSRSYCLISDDFESQEILDIHNYAIVGADNSYNDRYDCFYTKLDDVLTACDLSFGFLKYKNFSKNSSCRDISQNTNKYLNEYSKKRHFKNSFPQELTTEDIQYIEDKLTLELRNINNKLLECEY